MKRGLLFLCTGLLFFANPVLLIAKESCQHVYAWKTIEQPTHFYGGEKLKYCTNCGEKFETQEIPKQEHQYEDCICSCGSVISVDTESHALVLTKELYAEFGFPISGDIVLPEEVTYNGESYRITILDDSLFSANKDIVSVSLPDSIRRIGSYCFDGCSNLRRIRLSDNLQDIGLAAFQCCSSLEQLILPDSLEEIGGFGFNHCSNIQDSELRIGPNVICIGNSVDTPAHMFYDFGKDESFYAFTVDEKNPMYTAIDGLLYSKDGHILVSIPRGKEFDNHVYVMPDTVTNLGELSFSRNRSITDVVISDNLLITGELTTGERFSYNNYGNILSRSIYVFCPVARYQVKDSNRNYDSVDGVLYTKDGTTLVAVPNKYEGEIRIPEGVTTWQKEAIWSDLDYFVDYGADGQIYSHVSKIVIPSSLIHMGDVQIAAVNDMVNLYGTTVEVDDANQVFTVDGNGHLCKV